MELALLSPDAALVCLTVIFPGAVKRDERTLRVAREGVAAVREAFEGILLREELRDLETGYEGFFLVEASPEAAKRLCCGIEDTHPLGRLMDLDVIVLEEGNPVPMSRQTLGFPERKCLLCDRPARECMRARTHPPVELLRRIDEILQ